MENELDLLLRTTIDSLVKLEALLYLHARAGAVHTAEELAGTLRRPLDATAAALAELAEVGLVERFALGSGRHVMYGPMEDAHVQEILGRLHSLYHRDPVSRAELVRRVMGRHQPTPPDEAAAPESTQEAGGIDDPRQGE